MCDFNNIILIIILLQKGIIIILKIIDKNKTNLSDNHKL